jgi:hypothetical protein
MWFIRTRFLLGLGVAVALTVGALVAAVLPPH